MSPLETPAVASRGAGGMGPYQLLQQCLEEMSGAGLLAKERAAWSDTTVWAASHGIALLLLDSPMRKLDEAQQHDAIERLLEVVIAGLTDHRVRDISNPTTHETLPIGADENDA